MGILQEMTIIQRKFSCAFCFRTFSAVLAICGHFDPHDFKVDRQ